MVKISYNPTRPLDDVLDPEKKKIVSSPMAVPNPVATVKTKRPMDGVFERNLDIQTQPTPITGVRDLGGNVATQGKTLDLSQFGQLMNEPEGQMQTALAAGAGDTTGQTQQASPIPRDYGVPYDPETWEYRPEEDNTPGGTYNKPVAGTSKINQTIQTQWGEMQIEGTPYRVVLPPVPGHGNDSTPLSFTVMGPPPYLSPESQAFWNSTNDQINALITGWEDPSTVSMPDEIRRADPATQQAWVDRVRMSQYEKIMNLQKMQVEIINGEKPPSFAGAGASGPEGPAAETAVDTTAAKDMQGATATPAQDALAGNEQPAGGTAEAIDRYNQFKADPGKHPEGLAGWMRDRDAARAAGIEGTYGTTTGGGAGGTGDGGTGDTGTGGTGETAPPQTEPTGGGSTTTQHGSEISSDPIVNQTVDDFLKKTIEQGNQLSPEEEAMIKKNVDDAARPILSSMAARGLGRGSEVVAIIAQAEWEKVRQVGEAKARVRKEGMESALAASELMQRTQALQLERTSADRNYQLALQGQNLSALKNEQDVSFQDRAMALQEELGLRGAALDEAKFSQFKDQMEREFGLALDDQALRKFIATGELDLKAIDIDETNRLKGVQIANEFLLTTREQDIQDKLGIAKLDLEKWIAGEQIDVDKMKMATQKFLSMFQLERESDLIMAQLDAEVEAGNWQLLGQLGQTVMMGLMLM